MFLLIPGLVWAANDGLLRPNLTHLKCADHPESCVREEINWADRYAVDFDSQDTERWSYYTQNAAAVVALAAPGLWHLQLVTKGALAVMPALIRVSKDALVLFQATVWNGAINSTVRLIVQRPRPFVYRNPQGESRNPMNYTSFYSGHTSFAALAGVIAVVLLWAYRAPMYWQVIAAAVAGLLVFFTGIFRVLAGWHFVTDIIAATFAGAAIAYWVLMRATRRLRSPA